MMRRARGLSTDNTGASAFRLTGSKETSFKEISFVSTAAGEAVPYAVAHCVEIGRTEGQIV